MKRNRVIANGVLAVLLAAGSAARLPGWANPTPPTLHAQIQPTTLNGTLDSNSPVMTNDNSYFNTHTFEGQAGEQITIELTSSEFDSYLILLDPENNQIAEDDDGGAGQNARIIVTLPATGTYTIAVNSYEAGQTGNYTLGWRAITAEDLQLAEAEQLGLHNPEAINGRLDSNSPVLADDDSYYNTHTFEGKAGELIAIELTSSEFDSHLILLSPENNKIAEDNDGGGGTNARIIATLPSTGAYTIMASSFYGMETGNYTLSWQVMAEAEQLNPDKPGAINGRLDRNNPVLGHNNRYYNTYIFEGQAGDKIIIELTSSEFDSYLILLDPENNQIAVDDDGGGGQNAKIIGTLPTTGTYTIVVNSYEAGQTGSYTLSWGTNIAEDLGLAEVEQLNLDNPGMINGRLDSNRSVLTDDNSYYNAYIFEGQAGEQITIDLISSEFDSYLILLDPENNQIAVDDDGGGGQNARIIGTLPTTGTYTIVVNSYEAGQTGSYTLSWGTNIAEDLGLAEVEQLNLDNPGMINGRLDSNSPFNDIGYYKTYTFEGQVGEQITIDLISSDFDSYLILLDPNNNIIAEDDDSGGGKNATIIGILPTTGMYTIVTNAFPGEMGDYTLSWRASAKVFQVAEISELGKAEELNNEAVWLYEEGQYAEAIPLAEQALAIREKLLEAEHPHVATSLNNLALLYQAMGNYSAAESLYQRSLAILEKVRGAEHPAVAASLNGLAVLYMEMGNYSGAESLFQRALAIREHEWGAKHTDVAESLTNLGWLYQVMGNYSAAEPLYQRALTIWENEWGAENIYVGSENPYVALNLNNLATLYQAMGNYSAAEPLIQQALAIQEKVLGDEHPDIARSLTNLGWLYQNTGNYSAAEPLYQRSLVIREAALGAEHPDVAASLNNLAVLYLAQGNIPLATELLTRGTNIEETNLSQIFTTGSEKQKQAYANTFRSSTDRTISLHLQDAPNDPQAARLALTTLLRRKGRILDALTENLQLLRQNLTPENQTLLDDFIQTRSQLATLVYRRPEDIPDPTSHRQLINDLTAKADNLEAELARRSAQFRVATQPVDLAAVQAKIPANGVLIEYVLYKPYNAADGNWGEPRYAAYLLFPNGNLQSVDLGEAAPIDEAVESFRSLLQDPGTDLRSSIEIVLTERPAYIEQITTNIKSLVFDPIAPHLANVQHLLISPDSQLNLLPFEALQPETGGDYLVQQYQISYLNTGRDLVKFGIVPPSTEPAVVLANPDYDSADGSVQMTQANSEEPNPPTPFPARAGGAGERLGEPGDEMPSSPSPKRRGVGEGSYNNRRSTELSQLQFTPLPGTAAEVEAIRPLLDNPTILTATQATENALKIVRHPRILHIATHGFFLPDIQRSPDSRGGFRSLNDSLIPVGETTENPLLRSGLALAGFNPRTSGSEDGVLTALEAAQLNLFGTQLVVLSACETGLGDVANGEGVYGLRRAFSLAGAETQLMSLWQVSDEGTKDLMVQYYEKLTQGVARSQALREVQLEAIESGEKYSRPYYWAAFILAGNWK